MTGAALDALNPPARLNQREPSWRREARLAAIDWLAANSMPTHRDEAWRYSPVDQLVALVGAHHGEHPGGSLDAHQIDRLAGDHRGPRLVFVNGTFSPKASRVEAFPGGTATPFSDLPRNAPPGPEPESPRLDGFQALNLLAGDDGASVSIDAERDLPAPIHVVHVAAPGPDGDLVTHPSTVVHLHAGARATVIESYVGFDGAALTNAATVIEIDDRASLAYHRVQSEADAASHVGHVRARVGHTARLSATSFSLGAVNSRVAFDITADGDGASIDVDGLYLPAGDDRHDHVVTIEHLGSHTTSNERFKGVIDGRAHGSFTGQVIVRPGTIDTTAHQINHSLLLTSTAESTTRPWLEILADDVRCTHGATVGQLDDQALFYLRSRGIPDADARRMLIEAFVNEIIDAAGPDTLRQHLRSLVTTRPGQPRRDP